MKSFEEWINRKKLKKINKKPVLKGIYVYPPLGLNNTHTNQCIQWKLLWLMLRHQHLFIESFRYFCNLTGYTINTAIVFAIIKHKRSQQNKIFLRSLHFSILNLPICIYLFDITIHVCITHRITLHL